MVTMDTLALFRKSIELQRIVNQYGETQIEYLFMKSEE